MEKISKIFIAISVIFLACCYAAFGGTAADDAESYYDNEKGERVIKGLHFSVADDRVMEKRGQYYEPEGLDKYFKKKFEIIFDSLDRINKKLTEIDDRMTALELEIKNIKESNPVNIVDSESGTVGVPGK